jgi:CRISPR-associated protein Csm3
MNLQFQGKYIIEGKIRCETGLHIGGTQEGIEIGGVDNIVIRDPLTDLPYIPGSSLKGKLRHLLEWELNKIELHPKQKSYTAHFCGECDACLIFGAATDESTVKINAGPTRLTVRDAFPTQEAIKKWQEWLGENIYTELKTENAIDRVTSEANPRTMERVPGGSEFDFEMIFDIFRVEDKNLLKNLFTAMHLLENSALGGSGSRGHGKIKFVELKITFRSRDYYVSNALEEMKVEAKREKAEKPSKFILSGKLTGEVPYEKSIIQHLQSKLDPIIT